MKVWVTGANGVLGRRVAEAAQARGHDVLATTHWDCPIDSVDCVARMVQAEPDVVINCAGKLPGAPPIEMVMANSLGPHILAKTGVRMVHMSTDCVFSTRLAAGRVLNFPDDAPAPVDLYGRTKLAGEPGDPHVLVVRGSFVALDGGFLQWLLKAQGEVEAWMRATWNGTTADIMATKLVELAESDRTGLIHVASLKVTTKAWMVKTFAQVLGLPITIKETVEPVLVRALYPDVELPDAEGTMRAYAEELKRCMVET